MCARALSALSGAVLLAGCSEPSGPAAGMFVARLTGARTATLSGTSARGVVFSEQFPDGRYTITMSAGQGDTTRQISIQCPGQEPPALGSHAVSASEADCLGRYARILASTTESRLEVVEEASAASRSVKIIEMIRGQAAGTFSFGGQLVIGQDTTGTVAAAGEFSASLR